VEVPLEEEVVEAGKVKIVFMGTPEFALPSLNALLERGYSIPLVITQPDKPAGRGKRLKSPPVKEFAVKHGLEVIQPKTLKDESLIKRIKDVSPDFIVVVAYGKIIPKEILSIPKFCVLNVHASLLPKYRGASPIQSALLNGEKETGVTIMKVNEKLDSGEIFAQKRVPIRESDNAKTLHDKLSVIGAELLVKVISEIVSGKAKPTPQDESKATYCRQISKEEGRIDWSLKAETIFNMVRAFYPWPSAYTSFRGKQLKILEVRVVECDEKDKPGTIIKVDRQSFTVKAGDGCLEVLKVKPEGKREMSAGEFINGYRVSVGEVFA